ncbi:hypothetical protein RUM43_007259 [Polyplax serrata]|uniref:Uncharacterized protein n=1 Tax=Polyplax serrata TaxID=468196 RepID=A0AAN8S8K1_POLSC
MSALELEYWVRADSLTVVTETKAIFGTAVRPYSKPGRGGTTANARLIRLRRRIFTPGRRNIPLRGDKWSETGRNGKYHFVFGTMRKAQMSTIIFLQVRKAREKASHRFLTLRPEDLFYRREPNRKEEEGENENDDDDYDDDVED